MSFDILLDSSLAKLERGGERINTYLQQHTGKVDPTKEDSAYIFTIHFEFSTFRIFILVHKDYELDFSQGNFGDLLGFEKITLSGDVVGTKIPNITRSVDWVYLHCNIISRQTNNVSTDVLYGFSTADLRVSYPFRKELRRLEWQPVNKNHINEIRVWVTDGRNNILDLNGAGIAISLMIKKE